MTTGIKKERLRGDEGREEARKSGVAQEIEQTQEVCTWTCVSLCVYCMNVNASIYMCFLLGHIYICMLMLLCVSRKYHSFMYVVDMNGGCVLHVRDEDKV